MKTPTTRRRQAATRERKRSGLETTCQTLSNCGLGLTPTLRRKIQRQDERDIETITRGTLRGQSYSRMMV